MSTINDNDPVPPVMVLASSNEDVTEKNKFEVVPSRTATEDSNEDRRSNDDNIDDMVIASSSEDVAEKNRFEVIPSRTEDSNEDKSSTDETPSLSLLHDLFQRIPKYICSHDGRELGMVIVLALIYLALSFFTLQEPLDRPIPYQYINETDTYVLDLNLNKISEGDSISDTLVAVLACVVCPCFQFALTFLTKKTRWVDAHRTVCVYLLTLASNDCLTFMLKSYMGIQRPNFYQECEPNETFEYCTLTDGLMGIPYSAGSFPSGHASYTFASLTLLYLYLERNFGITSIRKVVTTESGVGLEHKTNHNWPVMLYRLFSILFGLIPVLAVFMTASRIVDNQHHPADIIAGMLMGTLMAYFFHSLWFPDPQFVRLDETPAYAR